MGDATEVRFAKLVHYVNQGLKGLQLLFHLAMPCLRVKNKVLHIADDMHKHSSRQHTACLAEHNRQRIGRMSYAWEWQSGCLRIQIAAAPVKEAAVSTKHPVGLAVLFLAEEQW